MEHDQPTNADILDAIQEFAASVDQRFDRVEADITTLKSDVSGLTSDVSVLKSDVVYLKMNMVTKAYLDGKLADQFSDIIQYVKRRVPGWVELGRAHR